MFSCQQLNRIFVHCIVFIKFRFFSYWSWMIRVDFICRFTITIKQYPVITQRNGKLSPSGCQMFVPAVYYVVSVTVKRSKQFIQTKIHSVQPFNIVFLTDLH